MKLNSYSFTTRGGREENQDSAAVGEEGAQGLYAVADGLGGHQNGKEASACVVKALLEAWNREKPEETEAWLLEQIPSANRKLLALQQEKHAKMKSTVVALAVQGGRASWAHVGDSRLYHLRDGNILHITEDHSMAYMKYKAGQISRGQIGSDPDQSSLLRALGSENHGEPESCSCDVLPGDGFLLCSDGLWEYLGDHEVLADWLKADSPKEWAELMMQRAISRIQPGNDNLTLITLMVAQ